MDVNTNRLDQLIETGENLVGRTHNRRGIIDSVTFVDNELFEQWRVSSLNFLEVTYKRVSFNYQNFLERCSTDETTQAKAGLAILRAIRDDCTADIQPSDSSITITDLPIHPRIAGVCFELYLDGHYSEAVLEASKALINFVKEKSRKELDGRALMTEVFSQKNAILAFNDMSSKTDFDEQQGMMQLFEGAVQAIRNPRGHDFPDDTPERAMEYISFISLLAKLVDESRKVGS